MHVMTSLTIVVGYTVVYLTLSVAASLGSFCQSSDSTRRYRCYIFVALFTKTVAQEPASVTPAPTQLTPKAPAPTAMSTFAGMMLWVAGIIQKNIVVFVGVIIIAVAIFLYGRKRRRDRLTGTG